MVFKAASEDIARSNSYMKFFQQLRRSTALKQIQILIKMQSYLLNGMLQT